MIHIRCMDDLETIRDDPELYREVVSYLLYCQHELREYADEDDDFDVCFTLLSAEDLPMLIDLGPPEEIVQVNIKMDGIVHTIYRIIYPTEVLFIPTDISEKLSF